MATFKDVNGKTWTVELDAPILKAVRKELSVNLADPTGKTFLALATNYIDLVDVLFVVCRGQAQAVGISDEDFGRGLKGDSLEQATEALLNAIEDFFPRENREMLRAVLEREKDIRDKSFAMGMAKIGDPALESRILAAMDAEMEREITGLLTRWNSATGSPAASASLPADSPSAN